MGPSSGKSVRISEDICPWLRGRTLNVSMPLAMLGLLIFFRASITAGSSPGTGSDGVAPLLEEQRAQRVDGLLDGVEIRIDGQRLLEARERARGLVELQPDHAVAAEGAEVLGVALQHLVAVGGRAAPVAEQVVRGRALVPALGEVGPAADDVA